jgi:2,3-bisphosphoglycerate-independent phosphoglycerate mutase
MSSTSEGTVALIILDGWGISREIKGNAVLAANTPFIDSLFAAYPHTEITCHGQAVGLPEGQMGNSEVGHLNLGAGRVVHQDISRIDQAIAGGSHQSTTRPLKQAIQAVLDNQSTCASCGPGLGRRSALLHEAPLSP